MYTPDEKKQLEALEKDSERRVLETSIKEVPGGYVINHAISFVTDDVVEGQTRQQYVAISSGDMIHILTKLYMTLN